MIVRDHPALSLSRQCRLLSLGRSSLYYTPKGESAETLVADAADRRAVPEVPVLRRPSDGASPAPRGRADRAAPGRSADAPDGAAGDLSGATRSAPAPGLPLSCTPSTAASFTSITGPGTYLLRGPGWRSSGFEPCLVRRYHLYPGAARLPLPGGDHGLGKPVRPGLAAVEHTGRKLLHRHARRGPGPAWQAAGR